MSGIDDRDGVTAGDGGAGSADGGARVTARSERAERMLRRVRDLHAARPDVVGPVARGGMARVDAVDDRSLGRRSAMKVIRRELGDHDSSLGLFIREAHITGQLEHPNIVPVHELGVGPDGRPYFTMKLVEGRTLEDVVQELPEGAVPHDRLAPLLEAVDRVCEALAFAHSRGVLHCDVKPSNVMLGSFGQVYLMDWGIARLLPWATAEGAADSGRRAVSSWVCLPPGAGVSGSPEYMTPEQAGGEDPDERTDVFGVGGLLYSIVVRHGPFVGTNPIESYAKALGGECPPVGELAPWAPRELQRIIGRAIEPELEDRYPSVAALQHDLKRFLRGGGEFPVLEVAAGELVIREGDEADAAYVIVSGRCQVYTGPEQGKLVLKELGEREVFGETAILASSPRTASVVALEPSRLMKISREAFQNEVDDMKPWMGAFTRALAGRFRELLLERVARGS